SACRLKDVNELFYDTGIGKEGYSIIGQGQIDKILSGKPEERRELFDEAAGIVKFKKRKAIAQKKLEDEKQNLIRIHDILTELEKQVGPLARQSESAREYLRLKEELKAYEVNLFLIETAEIRGQLSSAIGKEEVVSGDLEDVKNASDQIKETYEQLDGILTGLEEQITTGRSVMTKANLLQGNLEGQINVLLEQINTEKMNAEHIRSRIQTIKSQVEEKHTQIVRYEGENSEIKTTVFKSQKKQEEAEQILRKEEEAIMMLDQKIESGKGNIILTLNEKSSLTAKQQRYETMMEQVQIRRAEVCQKLLKSKSDESVQDEQLKTEQNKLREVNAALDHLQQAQEESETRILELDQEVRRLTRNLNEKQQEYHTTSTKLDSLKNLAERYEGYGNSIRKVMEVKDRIRGIHGVVADLITTKQNYETAIETALGGSIQNIVTDSEQTAKQLIEYLKKNQYGRATFLPLTGMKQKGGFTTPQALKEEGVLGLASELVTVDAEYESLVRYLLGRVVVVDQIDHAIALAKKYQYSLRIVTLEGELLNAGGSMTGGAFKNTSNLLGRKREIEELELRCEKAVKAADQLQADLSLQEGLLVDQRENVEILKTERQTAYLAQNTTRMNITQLEDKISEIAESAEDLVLENQQLEEQTRELSANQASLLTDVTGLESQNQQVNLDIEAFTHQLEETKISREQSAKNLAVVQLETANLQQKYSFVLENIKRVKDEIHQLDDEMRSLSDGTADTNGIIDGKHAEITALRELIAHAAKELQESELLVTEYTGQKEARSREQKGLFEKREALSLRMNQLDKELFRLQNQREKLEEKLENHVNYMWSEYELTYTTAELLRDSGLTALPELKKQIDQRKSEIKDLGNVNVNAIEDYKEVSERYEFMRVQHEDLIEAEATLNQIIDELDSGMRRQFEEKFKEIRIEFDKVFREMFGGGHGTLELMEGEDILEAGIQIISQPPGKKLQNMMQLSGGEKALTAIALLFSIQNLKPSPFCLLDEIEAALDDSNVDRFAGYLHKLTKYTQFIIITHRRGTMVAADRLYGITMQEKGVSTLISVNLIEDTLDK
ncbi:MAG: chromosome segregation protein SMC, partial [Hungatella sp.]